MFPNPLRRSSRPLVMLATATTLLASMSLGEAADAYKWSVQYLIDTSRMVFGHSQKNEPRNNRGLAISPDGRTLYAGYNKGAGGGGEVRRIAIDVADFDSATLAVLPGPRGKSIATDDKGRVYISDEGSILVCDGSLERRMLEIPSGTCEGLAVAREDKELALYATDREQGVIWRWVLEENGDSVVTATAGGFGGSGKFTVPGAMDLRGIEVDGKGNLWFCDLAGGKVFRMDREGRSLTSVAITKPIDIAIEDGRALVTRSTERAITVLDDNLQVIGNLSVPWEELDLSPFGNNQLGSLSGIVIHPGKGFFVANEVGQTANQVSMYGRSDARSESIKGRLVKDAYNDDNDPILRATGVTLAQ